MGSSRRLEREGGRDVACGGEAEADTAVPLRKATRVVGFRTYDRYVKYLP